MNPTNPFLTFAVIAQGNPLADLGSRLGGILAGAAAALLGVAVSAVIIYLLWNLLGELLRNPTPQKLGGIVAVALLAAFIAGATPSMVSAAFDYGQSFFAAGG